MIKVYFGTVEMPYEGPVEERHFATAELRDEWLKIAEKDYADDLEEGYLYLDHGVTEIFESMEEYELDRAHDEAIIENRARDYQQRLLNDPEYAEEIRKRDEANKKLLEQLERGLD